MNKCAFCKRKYRETKYRLKHPNEDGLCCSKSCGQKLRYKLHPESFAKKAKTIPEFVAEVAAERREMRMNDILHVEVKRFNGILRQVTLNDVKQNRVVVDITENVDLTIKEN